MLNICCPECGFAVISDGPMSLSSSERERDQALRWAASTPLPKPAGGLFVLGLVLLLPVIIATPILVLSFTDRPSNAHSVLTSIAETSGVAFGWLLYLGAFGTPALLVLTTAIRRMRQGSRWVRGNSVLGAVWRSGFYCGRCEGRFWLSSPGHGIPTQRLVSPLQFHQLLSFI